MWTERYRPRRLKQVFGQEAIIKRLEAFVADKRNMPHFLFAGPAGVGKTSTAIALGHEVFGKDFSQNFKELNASDSRGIDVVRTDIKNYASISPINSTFRILVLDEADNMTADAQQALRRTMEKYRHVKFVLICNYSSKIIEPIQSRCVIFRFKPIDKDQIEKRIIEITAKENIKVDEDAIKTLVEISNGDMRKLLNLLQAASAIDKRITKNALYEISGMAQPDILNELFSTLFSKGDFSSARKVLRNLLYDEGIAGKDLIKQIYKHVSEDTILNKEEKVTILELIGEIDFRLTEGSNDEIQLAALLAKMIQVRKI